MRTYPLPHLPCAVIIYINTSGNEIVQGNYVRPQGATQLQEEIYSMVGQSTDERRQVILDRVNAMRDYVNE